MICNKNSWEKKTVLLLKKNSSRLYKIQLRDVKFDVLSVAIFAQLQFHYKLLHYMYVSNLNFFKE